MAFKAKFDKFVRKYGTPVAVLLGCLIIAGSIYVSFGIPNQKLAAAPSPAPSQVAGEKIDVSADDDPVMGQAAAPVTMIEFGDFQCPFCRKFWRESLPQLKSEYIDTGKVKLVYRDFPLSGIHPGAEAAAEGAACASEQGKFWEMHDQIFKEQDKQGQGTVQFTAADLGTWARQIGLHAAEFKACLDSGKFKDEVKKDYDDGIAAGVTGTPGFFINGRVVRGALPFASFKSIIDEELSKR